MAYAFETAIDTDISEIDMLLDEEIESTDIVTDDDNLGEIILDFSNTEQKRINAIMMCSDSERIEYITRLTGMYQMTNISILASFLEQIVIKTDVDPLLKLECAKCLDKNGYDSISFILDNEIVPTPCRIEAIHILMNTDKYKNIVLKHFITFLNDFSIDCDFRYKNIIELEKQGYNLMTDKLCWILDNIDLGKDLLNKFEKELKSSFPEWTPTPDNEDLVYLMIEMLDYDSCKHFFYKYIKDVQYNYDYFIKISQMEFIDKPQNSIYYRILSGQYLLQKSSLSQDEIMGIYSILTNFANDVTIEYDRRADAADVLLQLGDENTKRIGRQIITELGINDRSITIFDNAQNVHTQEVEESVLETLEFFASIPIITINKIPIDFDYVNAQIEDILKTRSDESFNDSNDKIKLALNRIRLDRALYSKYNNTLSNILVKIWSYLTKHKYEKEMLNRLLEELIEMSGTCSTGFVSRLINVPSGFGDFSVRISWEDQIIANLSGRLNAKIRNISIESCKNYEHEILSVSDNIEDFQANVMMELTICSSNVQNRPNFNLFFRKNIAEIREEMYKEFTEYLDDTTFDLYMRKALSRYEGM